MPRYNSELIKCPKCSLSILPNAMQAHLARHASSTKVTAPEYPMTGAYKNDCPFCQTHNAILQSLKDGYFCRDCGSTFDRFQDDRGVWKYRLVERHHRGRGNDNELVTLIAYQRFFKR